MDSEGRQGTRLQVDAPGGLPGASHFPATPIFTQSDDMPDDVPDGVPIAAPTNIPIPDKDGVYICDVCTTKVLVGCGGSKNFLQHRASPACLKKAKKADLQPKICQTNTINSYFTKATHAEATSGKRQSQYGVTHKTTPPQRSSLNTSLLDPAHPARGPKARSLALLESIAHTAQELPSLVPEAKEDDEIARVVLEEGPEDPSDAWEHLDCGLNRLLGYGVDIEVVAQRVQRGPFGVEGLIRYIRGFVVDGSVSRELLEGKLE